MYICISFTSVATFAFHCKVSPALRSLSLSLSLSRARARALSFSPALSLAHFLPLTLGICIVNGLCTYTRTINIYDVAVVENIHD